MFLTFPRIEIILFIIPILILQQIKLIKSYIFFLKYQKFQEFPFY